MLHNQNLDYTGLETDFQRAECLQNILVDRATGGYPDPDLYAHLRRHFLADAAFKDLLPSWLRTHLNLDQFWQFIKHKHDNYADRRSLLWGEFSELLIFLESKETLPSGASISERLHNFDSAAIHFAWRKALERQENDPEGAITLARTILESVCKHILDAKGIEDNTTNIELSELYKATAKELNLAPEQHTEKIFKSILGGCSGIVNGLGSLRNKLGDAHGKGKAPVRPQKRHAELAVNLAGTMATFFIQTYEAQAKGNANE